MSVADILSINTGIATDAVTWNRAYSGQAALEPIADWGEGLQYWVAQGAVYNYGFGPFNAMPRSVRVMCNGDKFSWFAAVTAGLGDTRISIDRVPVPQGLISPAATGQNSILFKSAKPRLIELRTSAGIAVLYTQKPYDLWKPARRVGPRVLIMGDSWTSNSAVVKSMNACYWDIGPLIGSEDVWVDHFGGTGYTVTSHADGASGTQNRYSDRLANPVLLGQTWDLAQIAPDIVVVHGGGANDKFKGKTNQQVIDGAVAVFTTLRTKLPKAKLVFMEGFAPPGFTPATYNPNFIAIRQGVQTALMAAGIHAYYVDVATTKPWVQGAGTVAAPNADGLNSSIYISADTYHEVDAGGLYRRDRTARVLRKIIADKGALLDTLVA